MDKPVGELHGTTVMVIDVAMAELKERKVHIAEWDVELVGTFLIPATRLWTVMIAGGGRHAERLAAALAKLRDSIKDRNTITSPSPTPAKLVLAAITTPPAKRPAETDLDPFAEHF